MKEENLGKFLHDFFFFIIIQQKKIQEIFYKLVNQLEIWKHTLLVVLQSFLLIFSKMKVNFLTIPHNC